MNNRKIIVILGLIIAGVAGGYFITANSHIFGSYFYNSWNHMGPGFFRGHMMMGGIMHLLFWLVLLYAIFSMIGSRKTFAGSASDSAVEVLKKKYVNGEISESEFKTKMNHINI